MFAADLIGALADGVEHRLVHLRSGAGTTVRFPCPTTDLAARPGPLGFLRAARALRAEVDGFGPDVVQAHGGEALRLAVLAGLGRRRAIVYRRIGMAPAPMLAGGRRWWHRWLMRRADMVVCVAEAVRREGLDRLGLDPARTVTVPNAVASGRVVSSDVRDRTAVRAELGIAPDAHVTLSLGALSWEKDPLAALEVTAGLVQEGLTTHVFVGEGPLRGELTAKVTALGLDGRVVVTGSRNDVGHVLAAIDVLLVVSRPDGMEGMPAVVIEAGLAARPVVASGVAGVAEVVEDGVTGAVVAPGDRAGLRSALRRLIADPTRSGALGAAAAARCGERFTVESVAPRYRRIWEEAAGAQYRRRR